MIEFLALALGTTILSTIVGFGSGLLLVGAASVLFGIKWTVAVATHLYLFNTWFKTIGFWEHVEKRTALLVSAVALPATWWGTRFLLRSEAQWIEWILAAVIVIDLAIRPRESKQTAPGNRMWWWQTSVVAVIYGWLSGAVGSGSVVKAMYFRRLGWSHLEFVGTMAATALLLNVLKTFAFWQAGLVGRADLPLIAGLIGVSWLGVRIGKGLLPRMPVGLPRHLVRAMLLLVAIRLVL